ncbi:U3 small nucleolar RNA-associated protein 5 [Kwoniella mangroviensis CBS 10435]|uniref:U3 small nucleolar RNA-associated protein 5 n=1 Tax=Kwoniella mangroviensis CBS 10435 TaxID=1331196 RepID=A0A1B9IHU8_9TREE|nr:U3 small nucleolar RNA-associated protein 5 [Kwoniella mangroviensis CBS 10435]
MAPSRQPVAGPSRPKHSQQPIAHSPPPSSSVSSFNPSRTLFALASPVLGSADKVQVWDVAADRVISEWEVAGASKATTVTWTSTPSSDAASKKKKRRKSGPPDTGDEEVILITSTKGQLAVFSPSKGEIIRTIDLSQPATAAWSDEHGIILATSSSILVLSADASSVSHTFTLPSSSASPSALAILPSSTPEVLQVLVGTLSVVVFHLDLSSTKITYSSAPLPASTTSISSILPLPTSEQGSSFLVVSEDDRTISQYTILSPQTPPKLSYQYASPTLSSAHSLSTSSSLLSVLHASGEISLFHLPNELDFSRPKSDSKPSTVKLVEGKDERTSRLCRVAFAAGHEGAPGALLCGRMTGGGRVKWLRAVYELPEGGLRPSTVVKCDSQDLVGDVNSSTTMPIQRFTAPANVTEAPAADADEAASKLPTDVDMADLSLGERMLAIPNGTASVVAETEASTTKAKPSAEITFDGPVNAASLTRVLVQALHTSDPALLTLCLSHRNPTLIRNTIRKMPAQLALPLLKACVERLGQGKSVNKRGGGRGSVQNEQQGRGTVEWVKGVLVERGALLMTMPSLPLHLATLSKLLQTRLETYQPLSTLSGRLDLALAQIQMRRLAAEAASQSALNGGQKGGEGQVYIEGESDDEDDVPIEMGEDGEIEDINMLAGSEDESSDEEDEDEDEDDDDEESEEDVLESDDDEGLLDLEAEESEDEDDEGESDDE